MSLFTLKKQKPFVGILSVVSLMIFSSSCSAHEIGGKSASDIFNDESIISTAISICDGGQSKAALSSSLKVNQSGLDGFTLLMWAMSCNNKVAVESLLDLEADPNLSMKNGMTPIILASENKDNFYLKTLLDHGGNASAGVGKGHTHSALGRSAKLGVYDNSWENFDALIAADANIKSDNPLWPEYTIGEYLIEVYGAFCKVEELVETGKVPATQELKYTIDNMPSGSREKSQACKDKLLKRFED